MMAESIKLPTGFHFSPFEWELIDLYLKPKVLGQNLPCNLMEEIQLYGPDANPWQLFDPENHPWLLSEVTSGKFEKSTYVFVNLTKKGTAKGKKTGKRENYNKRAGCGTWDGQTKRSEIRDCNGDLIGEKRMLVFEINEVCDQDLSKVGYWKMHEYHLGGVNKDISNPGNTVLCKITLDSSRHPFMKLRSSKPEKKNTNVHIAGSPSTVHSGFDECNQGVSGSSEGAIGTKTRRDDSVVSGSSRVKVKEECSGTENVQTSDGVECVNSSNVQEDTAVIASLPSKEVKAGNLNPSLSDFHLPAKKDSDCEKIKVEGGEEDLHLSMTNVQFSGYQKPKEEQPVEETPVEETTTNPGKRKLGDETSPYTMTKKLCP